MTPIKNDIQNLETQKLVSARAQAKFLFSYPRVHFETFEKNILK